jgi:hypothetical protein
MKTKITIDDAKKLLVRVSKSCIKSIEIVNGEENLEEIIQYRRFFSGKVYERVKTYRYGKISVDRFIDYWDNGSSSFNLGSRNIRRKDNHFLILPYILIRLVDLSEYDIQQSSNCTLEIKIWNESFDISQLKLQFNELKEFISNMENNIEDTYFNFHMQK